VSYQTIKNYLARRMQALGYFESKKKLNFEDASENFDKKFIIENPESELGQDSVNLKFNPFRTFVIRVAKKTSELNLQGEYDIFQQAIDFIIKDIHSVNNFRVDNLRHVQYSGHEVEVVGAYVQANISFLCEDEMSYV